MFIIVITFFPTVSFLIDLLFLNAPALITVTLKLFDRYFTVAGITRFFMFFLTAPIHLTVRLSPSDVTLYRSPAALNVFPTRVDGRRVAIGADDCPAFDTESGAAVGVTDGVAVGVALGTVLGAVPGSVVGVALGSVPGVPLGDTLGSVVGVTDDVAVGAALGIPLGVVLGAVVGVTDGVSLGSALGVPLGDTPGSVVGTTLGVAAGSSVAFDDGFGVASGSVVGVTAGVAVGFVVGTGGSSGLISGLRLYIQFNNLPPLTAEPVYPYLILLSESMTMITGTLTVPSELSRPAFSAMANIVLFAEMFSS